MQPEQKLPCKNPDRKYSFTGSVVILFVLIPSIAFSVTTTKRYGLNFVPPTLIHMSAGEIGSASSQYGQLYIVSWAYRYVYSILFYFAHNYNSLYIPYALGTMKHFSLHWLLPPRSVVGTKRYNVVLSFPYRWQVFTRTKESLFPVAGQVSKDCEVATPVMTDRAAVTALCSIV